MKRILCDTTGEVPLPGGATRSFPVGWRGDVTDDVADLLVGQGVARVLDPDDPESEGSADTSEIETLKGEVAELTEKLAAAENGKPEAKPAAQVKKLEKGLAEAQEQLVKVTERANTFEGQAGDLQVKLDEALAALSEADAEIAALTAPADNADTPPESQTKD